VLQVADLAPGQTLVDLGCGRGGPGLWLAREAGALLIGVDFSPVAADQATHRAVLFGLTGPLVLTNWQPNVPGDSRLPPRARIDWPSLLRGAGFTGVEMEARPEWHDTYTRVYRAALSLGDPGDDTLLAGLQDEARQRLPLAGLQDRVVVIATAARASQGIAQGNLRARRGCLGAIVGNTTCERGAS